MTTTMRSTTDWTKIDWRVAPRDQGQTVELGYAWAAGRLYRRELDRADGAWTVEVLSDEDAARLPEGHMAEEGARGEWTLVAADPVRPSVVVDGVERPSDERATCDVCGVEGWRGDFPDEGAVVHDGAISTCDDCAAGARS